MFKSEKVKITHQVKRIRGSFEKQRRCTQCRSRAVRIIGKDQYFCSDCCTEFKVCGNKVTVYAISTDGIKYELWWIYLPRAWASSELKYRAVVDHMGWFIKK